MSEAFSTLADKTATIPTWGLLIPAVFLIAQSSLAIQKGNFSGNDRIFINVTLAIGVFAVVWALYLLSRKYLKST